MINVGDKVMEEIREEGIGHEITRLCKLLKTSRPEQYIYTYIKEIFPSVIRGKQFDWMYNSAFDLFIPELNLAIEYDGFHWHNENGYRDLDKNKLAKKHNITVFRIRERGLKKTNCDYYFYNYNKTYTNIDEAINAIIDFINKKYDKNIEKIKEFNFSEIKLKTLENLREQKKEQSIIGVWKELEKYWDYDQNKGIKPEDVRPTSKDIYSAVCPYCNENVKFKPHLSYYYYGRYSFTPHICKELDNYCISLIEKKCKSGKFELSMENLDDRRIKDWLIRVAKHGAIFTTIRDANVFDNIEKKIGFKINYKNLYNKKIASAKDLG